MKTILYLHGFFSSGSCEVANALKGALADKVRVLTPDLPMRPKEALTFIIDLCERENPDLLVGNSCGSFLAQIIAPIVGIPALLGNPYFKMTEFLQSRIGNHQYKSPRKDGIQDFIIDDSLISEFAKIEEVQFNYTNPYWTDKIWGLFGEQDTLANFESLFLEHYNMAYQFPGSHTPSENDIKTWHVPLIEKMLMTYKRKEQRYFCHFKGGMYKLIHTAYDSETQERMVVYQAQYGAKSYWVRPEKMFFENVTRDGKTFSRFVEIDNE